jgi:hypothetical protein
VVAVLQFTRLQEVQMGPERCGKSREVERYGNVSDDGPSAADLTEMR